MTGPADSEAVQPEPTDDQPPAALEVAGLPAPRWTRYLLPVGVVILVGGAFVALSAHNQAQANLSAGHLGVGVGAQSATEAAASALTWMYVGVAVAVVGVAIAIAGLLARVRVARG